MQAYAYLSISYMHAYIHADIHTYIICRYISVYIHIQIHTYTYYRWCTMIYTHLGYVSSSVLPCLVQALFLKLSMSASLNGSPGRRGLPKDPTMVQDLLIPSSKWPLRRCKQTPQSNSKDSLNLGVWSCVDSSINDVELMFLLLKTVRSSHWPREFSHELRIPTTR